MPTYDYRCIANGQKVEVNHRMAEDIKTWGELCQRTGIGLGDTPANSPVERMATGGNIIGTSQGAASSRVPDLPPCASGGCGGGMCGF